MGVIMSILVNAAALFVAAKILPGIVTLLSLPITILTLGLFHFVVNAGLLGLTAWLTPGFTIDGFWAALFGAIIVSLVGMFLSGLTDLD